MSAYRTASPPSRPELTRWQRLHVWLDADAAGTRWPEVRRALGGRWTRVEGAWFQTTWRRVEACPREGFDLLYRPPFTYPPSDDGLARMIGGCTVETCRCEVHP